MLFPTFIFGVFFLVLFAVAWAARGHNEWRKILILIFSWVFYGAWDWRFVALLIASALINWSAARTIARLPPGHRRRAVLVLGVAANLGILVFFKYWNFFLQQVGATLSLFGWERDLPLMSIILPVGISFFTFQGMSYLIDVWRGKVAPARLLDVTLLMSFFAHLVAGPIVRASDLIPQFERPARLTREAASVGLLMIVWGLFKKAVIASELATGLVDPVFFDPGAHGQADLIAATYGYAVQIYCDFSAYSDMAIGLAALLGYRFPQNFRQPYRASSLQDFWRDRWHISLSHWLRDYLYIPLGGNRSGVMRTYFNLFATMVLGGLWHGANVTFLIWGALHGGVLCLERLWTRLKPKIVPNLPKIVGIVVTFHIVCLGWIFFRSQSFGEAMAFLGGLGRNQPTTALTVTPLAVALIVFGLAMQASPERLLERVGERLARLPALAMGASLAAMMVAIEALRPEGVAPFIYYQF